MESLFDSIPQGKVCSKCGRELPLSKFYVKFKRTGRLHARCKDCHAAVMKEIRLRDPAATSARSIAWQKANPDRVKAIQARSRAKWAEEFRIKARAYQASHREEKQAYRKANADRTKTVNAAYREAHKDEIAAKGKAYYRQNKAACHKRVKAAQAKKPTLYAEIKAAVRHKRQARKRAAEGHFTAADWRAIKKKYGHRCLRCGTPESVRPLTPDHVIPLAKGGTNWPGNIAPLCLSCNSSKNDYFMEFRSDRLLPAPFF